MVDVSALTSQKGISYLPESTLDDITVNKRSSPTSLPSQVHNHSLSNSLLSLSFGFLCPARADSRTLVVIHNAVNLPSLLGILSMSYSVKCWRLIARSGY